MLNRSSTIVYAAIFVGFPFRNRGWGLWYSKRHSALFNHRFLPTVARFRRGIASSMWSGRAAAVRIGIWRVSRNEDNSDTAT